MKRYCVKCGKEFDAKTAAVRYCDDCKEIVRKEWLEKQKQYAKERIKNLGLVNISVKSEDKDYIKEYIKKLAENTSVKLTIADVVHMLVEKYKIAETVVTAEKTEEKTVEEKTEEKVKTAEKAEENVTVAKKVAKKKTTKK